MIRTIALLAALAVSGPACAQIFKCTGKDGRVTYSQTRPTGAACQENAVTAPPPNGGNVDNLKQFAQDIDKEQKAGATQQQRAANEAAVREARCRQARANQAMLAQVGRIATVDEKGERHYLDEAQNQRTRAEADAAVARECS